MLTEFGIDGRREVPLDLRGVPGLGLAGPRAADAARTMLVAILSNGGPLSNLDHVRVVITSADLVHLVGAPLPSHARLKVVDYLEAAIDRLEAECLDRRRVLASLEVRDAADVRRFYPDHTLEPVVLIAAPKPAADVRTAATSTTGRAADIHAILLGEWASGTTAFIDDDGSSRCPDTPTTPSRPSRCRSRRPERCSAAWAHPKLRSKSTTMLQRLVRASRWN